MSENKKCREDQILNPKTKRCVKKNGVIGKTLLQENELNKQNNVKTRSKNDTEKHSSQKDKCKNNKILNPVTNRCVKIDGKIGKMILAAAAAKTKPNLVNVKKSPKSVKKEFLDQLKIKCNNDTDSISLENFEDLTLEELQSLVFIGNGNKKNCYLLDNIYEVYKTAVLKNKIPKDPMDPSHKLTKNEIDDINTKMKKKNHKYVPPKFELPKPYPEGYQLVIDLNLYQDYFTINVMNRTIRLLDLGVIPAEIETHNTGSADYTSAVLISNIRELWDKRLLIDDMNRCTIDLGKTVTYWQGSIGIQRFINLCEQVKEKLEQ
jgi:hypothetical protein